MELIPLPTRIDIQEQKNNSAVITIEPCYPGYGTTIGNALRRVLLSSIPGSAITKMQIKGATHEFTTLPGVKEDMVELILNIKLIRVLSHSDEPVTVELRAKGEGVVRAKDIKATSDVEIVSDDQPIATLTDKDATLDITFTIEKGKGYVPVEMQQNENDDLGTIAIDAIFNPVRNVNFNVEHVRVGEITNFDKVVLTIATDGSMSPKETFHMASDILVQHFQVFGAEKKEAVAPKAKKSKKTEA